MLAFGAAGDPRYRPKMKKILARLLRWQRRGTFGYPHGHPDLSNTQYAALGFRAAYLAGIKVPPKAWLELMTSTLKYQERERMLQPPTPVRSDEGTYAMPGKVATAGFCYRPHDRKPTGSMTTAGISILAFCQQAIGKRIGKRRAKLQFAIDKGLRWLARNFSVSSNPGKGGSWHYYYLYGLERVGGALDIEYIGPHHWYLEGARVLVKKQSKDGSWRQAGEEPDTCFAILFLKRATAMKGAVTGGPRRRDNRHAAADKTFDVQLRGTGSQHLAVWVSGFGKDVLEQHKKHGLRVQRVDYHIEGKKIASVPGNPKEVWTGQTFPTKHSFTKRGSYQVTASVYVVDASTPVGTNEPVVELSNPGFTVDVPRILIEMEDEPIFPNRLAKLRKRHIKTKASSVDGGNKPEHAVDGLQSTRWLCKGMDKAPTLTISLDKTLLANTIVLRQAATRSRDVGNFDRIDEVEIVLNGKDRFPVKMNANEIAATVFRMKRARKIRQVQLVVKSRKAGGRRRGVVGISELSLQKRK